MLALFRELYYPLDLLIGFGAPLVLYLLVRTGHADRFLWRLFWLGALVGLSWEIPIFVLSGEQTALPIITWIRPLPAHYAVFLVCHTLWDGLLFVLGVLLTKRLCRPPHFTRFRLVELAVLFLWGQLSALLVEISSTLNDAWIYVDHPWNPALFHVNGHAIQALIQWIWLLAAVVYYLLLLRLSPSRRGGAQNPRPLLLR